MPKSLVHQNNIFNIRKLIGQYCDFTFRLQREMSDPRALFSKLHHNLTHLIALLNKTDQQM